MASLGICGVGELPKPLFSLCAVTVFSSLIVIALITPVMVFGFVPLAFVYTRIQRLYIATSRELKRLDSLAFSPIFSHLNESLQVRFPYPMSLRQVLNTDCCQKMEA